MLRRERIESAAVYREPFEFFVGYDVLPESALRAVERDFPPIERPANFPPEQLEFGPAFAALLEELLGEEFRGLIARKFTLDLGDAAPTVTVRGRSERSDGNIHTDHWSKLVTVILYLNQQWHAETGRLRLLYGPHDLSNYVVEVPPKAGTLVAFRRAPNSYHGYRSFEGERRMVQLSWVSARPLARTAQRMARFATHTAKRGAWALRRRE